MTNNKEIIYKFYKAFQHHDPQTMASCYHPNIVFEDPAFGKLQGEQVVNMWKMLLERGDKNMHIDYADIKADDNKGSAKWEATYNFSKTGRPVHNKIKASFEFEDELIIRHSDYFDFWKWSRMALGAPGFVFGYTRFFQRAFQKKAKASLLKYIERK